MSLHGHAVGENKLFEINGGWLYSHSLSARLSSFLHSMLVDIACSCSTLIETVLGSVSNYGSLYVLVAPQ